MNIDLSSPPPEHEMPAASVQARRQHLLREARRTTAGSGRRWIGVLANLPASRKIALVAVAVCVVIGASVGTATAVGWIFNGSHFNIEPARGTSLTYHQRTMINGHEWAVVTYTNSDGKYCLGLKSGGGLGRSCTTRAALFSDGPLAINTGWTGEAGAMGAWLFGFTEAPVKKVLLQFSDCSQRDVPLDADGIFLYIAPGPYAAPGSPDQSSAQRALALAHLPQRVLGLDDSGATVVSKDVPEVKANECATP